ncbi:MAG: hypothetical protein ABIQ09_09825 [Jatrophihabitantaceae bacterium]
MSWSATSCRRRRAGYGRRGWRLGWPSGAAAGAILTHREGGSRGRTALAGALGLLGAAAGSRLGASWRQAAGTRFGKDLPGALIEDACCAAAVRYASRA